MVVHAVTVYSLLSLAGSRGCSHWFAQVEGVNTAVAVSAVMWLAIKKPGVGSWHFWACWFCAIFGIIVTILGAIGGEASTACSAQFLLRCKWRLLFCGHHSCSAAIITVYACFIVK